jgi:hypothetical protein
LNREGGLPLKTSKEFMIRICQESMRTYVYCPLIPQFPFKFSCRSTHLEEVGRVGEVGADKNACDMMLLLVSSLDLVDASISFVFCSTFLVQQ